MGDQETDHFKVGEKVFYVDQHKLFHILTIKEVSTDDKGFEILYVEEFEGYIDSCDVIKKETLLEMFTEAN